MKTFIQIQCFVILVEISLGFSTSNICSWRTICFFNKFNSSKKNSGKTQLSDKFMIYLLTYEISSRQYTGQTGDSFSISWNNSKCNNRKLKKERNSMQKYWCNGFYIWGHEEFFQFVFFSELENRWFLLILSRRLPPEGLNIKSG